MTIVQGLGDPASLDSWTVNCGFPVFEIGATSVGRGAREAPDLFQFLDEIVCFLFSFINCRSTTW